MITDEMLISAAAEVTEALLASLPDPAECNYTFSPRFEHRMKRLIRKGNHPVIFRMMRYAACFLIALLLSFMTLMVVSPTVRATVADWIRSQMGAFTQYYFANEETAQEDNIDYELGYVPEEYVKIKTSKTKRQTTCIYVDNTLQKILSLYYSKEKDIFLFSVNDSNFEIESVSINNVHADLYISKSTEENSALIWLDVDNQYFLCLSANMDRSELIHIAENIYIKNK